MNPCNISFERKKMFCCCLVTLINNENQLFRVFNLFPFKYNILCMMYRPTLTLPCLIEHKNIVLTCQVCFEHKCN